MGELPVANAVRYRSAHILDRPAAEVTSVIDGPITLTADPGAAKLPATGVLLTHEQTWTLRGLALGNLQHSVTLAPGEVTRVAVVDWNRQEQGRSDESTSQDDSSDASDRQNRAVSEVQAATAKEVQYGGSVAAAASVTASGSYGGFGTSVSAAATASLAVSANYSHGEKDVGMSANQQVNAATQRHAEASRSRRSATVKETNQSEHEELSARVLANYNHAHSLTMMYFEVIEVFRVTTRVVQAEPLIFLPMQIVDVDLNLLRRFAGELAATAEQRGDSRLAEDIRAWDAAEHAPVPPPAPVVPAPPRDARPEIRYRAAGALTADDEAGGWDDHGNELKGRGMYVWVPTAVPKDWYLLGHHMTSTSGDPGDSALLLVQPGRESEDALVPPVGFEAVFRTGNAGISDKATLWRPIPPEGYVALGLVTHPGANAPSTDTVRCVREDLVTDATAPSAAIWWYDRDEHKNGAPWDPVSIGFYPAKARDDNGFACGTFVTGPSKPGAGPAVPALKVLKRSAISEPKPVAPRVDSAPPPTPRTEDEILRRINRDRLPYNQAIWFAMEPEAVVHALAGTSWPAVGTVSLSEVIDPTPVSLSGNYVGYRYHLPNPKKREQFKDKHIRQEDDTFTDICIGTGGVFGEAVLGESVAAEKIDLTRFWKWQDSPIPILPPDIAPVSAGGRARDISVGSGQLDASAAQFGQLSALPDPTGLGAIGAAVQAQLFRDMSGSEVVKALALDASAHAAASSDHAADVASKNLGQYIGLMKDLAQMAVQHGGLDSTTLGGMQGVVGEAPTSGAMAGIEDALPGGALLGDLAGVAETVGEVMASTGIPPGHAEPGATGGDRNLG